MKPGYDVEGERKYEDGAPATYHDVDVFGREEGHQVGSIFHYSYVLSIPHPFFISEPTFTVALFVDLGLVLVTLSNAASVKLA